MAIVPVGESNGTVTVDFRLLLFCEEIPMKSVPDAHQIAIAKKTLRLSDVGAMILGGMTKEEARSVLREKAGWSSDRISQFES